MDKLTVGMYLDTECKIARMVRFKYGWKMTDTTGAEYRQKDFPNGLHATTHREPDVTKRPVVPWPE